MSLLDVFRPKPQDEPPPAAPAPAPVSHAHRKAALEGRLAAIRSTRDRKVSEHQRAAAAARDDAERAIQEANDAANAERLAISASLALDVQTKIAPCFARLEAEPNAAARALIAAFEEINDRCELELGEPLSEKCLGYNAAFALGLGDEHYPFEDNGPDTFWGAVHELALRLAGRPIGLEVARLMERVIVAAHRATRHTIPRFAHPHREGVILRDAIAAIEADTERRRKDGLAAAAQKAVDDLAAYEAKRRAGLPAADPSPAANGWRISAG